MIQLDAITLRGVGSYIRGSRLSVRPLTILSGINGSGKSTWLKSLEMLRRSLDHLPFAFAVDDSNAFDVEFMNYPLYCSSDLTSMADDEEEHQFGPPACIGVEFTATEDVDLGEPSASGIGIGVAQQFLLQGQCPKGTRLRVRIAHPTSNTDSHVIPETPGMTHHVELKINEVLIAFRRPHRPDGRNIERSDYTLYRSSVPFPGLGEAALRDLVASRIRWIMRKFFDGYFHISAVRSLPQPLKTGFPSPPDDNHARRDVHRNGDYTLNVFYWNSRPEPPESLSPDRIAPPVFGELEKGVDNALRDLVDVKLTHEWDDADLGRFTNAFLTGAQVPRQLSSGFHQLFPIIVQLAVMRPGELLSIENPEVHLHPDLQLEVSEYLLGQSRQNRRVMIETHSDLIIRRVIRAILDEEDALSQQHVSLNFTDAETGADDRTGSVLHPFGVDAATGRIEWPKGFMDASINESQRLMDVMYGRNRNRDGEETE